MASKAKNMIVNVFLKLIETEEYDKITVTHLVEECDISRQTFYYHFNDIDEMIAFAFSKETKSICDAQESNKWFDSALLYVDFLNKFDTLLRKAAASSSFLFVYGLLYKSFSDYINSYIQKRKKNTQSIGTDASFLTAGAAHAFCGLVIDEIQKEQSDYATLLENIGKALNALPK